MKKVLKVTLLIVMCLLLASTVVKAAENLTVDELKAYIKSSINLAGHENELDAVLASKTFSAEELTAMKSKVDEGLALMKEAGVTDPTKLTGAQKEELLNIASEAAEAGALTLAVYDDGSFSVFGEDGRELVSSSISEFKGVAPKAEDNKEEGPATVGDKFQPTGSSILPVLGLVAIIAGATFVVVKRVNVSAN